MFVSATAIFLLLALIFLAMLLSRSFFGGKNYSLSVDNLDREYKVHLPKGYKEKDKYPLVIVLHGLGDSPALVELNSGFSKKANQEKFIALYPKGTGKKLSWNAKFCCGDALKNKVNDVKFVDSIIRKVEKDYPVDTSQIFIVGFSNGGMMAYRLAVELPYVKAMGIIAGTIGSNKNKIDSPQKETAAILVQGEKDKTVPLAGGGEFSFLSPEQSIKVLTGEAYNKTEKKTDDFSKITYAKAGKPDVVLYVVKDRGHIWFGGLQDYILNRKRPKVFATDLIWDFFKSLN